MDMLIIFLDDVVEIAAPDRHFLSVIKESACSLLLVYVVHGLANFLFTVQLITFL